MVCKNRKRDLSSGNDSKSFLFETNGHSDAKSALLALENIVKEANRIYFEELINSYNEREENGFSYYDPMPNPSDYLYGERNF